ncbi:MAG TPA: elongation factor Ts [Alphaproteobacteria bacterium]|nr:elongation factor Ts [Alphaproteobacteria bacterium]HBA43247.1 elongation factor Ts [Alphaproteobacteria bacterium]HBC54014.1 elongation factor Ts [Alphaproteobacteria bacterium]
MAEITTAQIKELRESTGAGMMDCKKALVENNGDMEAAVDWLRTKGLAKAAKKAGRVAAEGLVGVASRDNIAALVELNSETDFAARSEAFQDIVRKVTTLALDAEGDLDKLLATPFPGSDRNVGEYVAQMVGTIGENMNVRRTTALRVSQGVVANYIHNQTVPGLGKIGVIVALESSADADKLADFGKQVAMHIAAAAPLATTTDELDPQIVERERAVLIEQARESGKPENIIEKMVEGRIRKYYEEVVLLSQPWVMDPDLTVAKAVEAAGKELGAAIAVTGFARFVLGEGIEKEEGDFAAEVAAAAS